MPKIKGPLPNLFPTLHFLKCASVCIGIVWFDPIREDWCVYILDGTVCKTFTRSFHAEFIIYVLIALVTSGLVDIHFSGSEILVM